MKTRRIVVAVVIIIFVLRSTMLAILLLSRWQDVPVIEIPDAEWLPGSQSTPDEAICFFDRYPELYCGNADKSLVIRYSVDLHQISYTRQMVHDLTVGKLISAWGNPQGSEIYSTLVEVWWSDRYAIVYTFRFSPTDEVEYVMWDSAPIPRYIGEWRGFATQ